jgi:hypothetical protein
MEENLMSKEAAEILIVTAIVIPMVVALTAGIVHYLKEMRELDKL